LIISKKLKKFADIEHGFFNRNGGTSSGIYRSLNCGIGSLDNKKNVFKNLKIVCKKIGCSEKKLVLLNQIHSNKYSFIGNNKKFIKKKIKNLNLKDLQNKNLLSDEIGIEASQLAKDKSIRELVHSFQINFAYNPPKKFNGSCLDGRDITYKIVPDADFKFFITANLQTRTLRRYNELKKLNKKITYKEVQKSIKKRDKSDFNRRISPLKKTKDSILINTSNLSKRACFLKIKKIIDRKLNI